MTEQEFEVAYARLEAALAQLPRWVQTLVALAGHVVRILVERTPLRRAVRAYCADVAPWALQGEFTALPESEGRLRLVRAFVEGGRGQRSLTDMHRVKDAFVARWGWDAADSAMNYATDLCDWHRRWPTS